jgi:hypothetical protein
MQSIEKQIKKLIKSKPKCSLVLSDDYLSFCSSEAIRKALDRLQDKSVIYSIS